MDKLINKLKIIFFITWPFVSLLEQGRWMPFNIMGQRVLLCLRGYTVYAEDIYVTMMLGWSILILWAFVLVSAVILKKSLIVDAFSGLVIVLLNYFLIHLEIEQLYSIQIRPTLSYLPESEKHFHVFPVIYFIVLFLIVEISSIWLLIILFKRIFLRKANHDELK